MIKQKKWNKKRVVIFISIVIFITILMIISIINSNKKNTPGLPYEMSKIEDIFEYYNCKFVKKVNSKDERLKFDIYANFDRDYYTEDVSNKAYFNGLISYISENLEYVNYQLLDSSRNIVIVVLGNTEEKCIEKIYFNGEMTYFEKKDNEKNIENYEKIETTKLQINSKELNEIIKNNWQSGKVNFGTQESIFNEYNIYFDEGIEVKTTASKIYNVVFTEKYTKEITNGLKVNSSTTQITNKLGTPTFSNKNLGITGYKGEECYIFFSENEVSVYRVENEYKNDDFIKIVEQLMKDKKMTSFANSLTDIWQDYDLYITDEDGIQIRYSIKGIEINFTKSSGKLTFYNNYAGEIKSQVTLNNINTQNIPEYAKLELDTDLVYEREQERKSLKTGYYLEDFIQLSSESAYEESVVRNVSDYNNNKFYIQFVNTEDGIKDLKFISINRQYANSEFKPNVIINYYGWRNDIELIYSINKRGIFKYNTTTRKTTSLIEGNINYEIMQINNEEVIYNNGETIKLDNK